MANSLLIAGAELTILIAALRCRGKIAVFTIKAAAVAAVLSLIATGHAASAEPRWLTRPMLGLHVLTVAFWVGSLGSLWLIVRSAPLPRVTVVVRSFARLAMGAVGVLVVAGAVVAAIQLASLHALFGTPYGQRFAIKLGLVLLLVLLAATNKLWLTPALMVRPWARAYLRCTIGAEVALAATILAVTASLGQAVPPRALLNMRSMAGTGDMSGMGDMVEGAPGFSVLTYREGNGALIELTPAHTGPNDVTVHLLDPEGKPMNPQEATLELSNAAAGIEPISYRLAASLPGLYHLNRVSIVTAGEWTLRLDALVTDFSKLTFETKLTIR